MRHSYTISDQVEDFCFPACAHAEECGESCVGSDDTDCMLWKTTKTRCPSCLVQAMPQNDHELALIEPLKRKDGIYRCPVCGEEYDDIDAIVAVLIDDILSGNRYYARQEARNRLLAKIKEAV